MTRPPDRAPHAALPATVVLGVLGGIAAGKSAVARLLAGPDGLVLSADAAAHEALESPEVVALLVDAYGPGILDARGRPDRAALGRRVFAAPTERARLEGWIHPRVREKIRADLARARAAGVPRIVLDVPLLLENDEHHGLVRQCDHLVFVEVSAEERERRARALRGWETGEVTRREAAQLPLPEKKMRAHVVVRNEGSLADLARAVNNALAELGLAPGPPLS
jgi:dephospho-CoA kinase